MIRALILIVTSAALGRTASVRDLLDLAAKSAEREIAALYFCANHGPQLINRLVDLAQTRCPEHKVLRLTP